MTILVSDMGDTVVAAVNRGTFTLADWTVMPKAGRWHDFLEAHPQLKEWLERKTKEREAKKRIARGFSLQNPDEEANAIEEPDAAKPTLEKLAEEAPEVTEHELARKLALAIKRVANDLRLPAPKKYSYEEWVDFTRLIRFSRNTPEEVMNEEEEEGLVEWDWIGEDSPMLADISESEWALDRLCESLNRYTRKMAKDGKKAQDLQDRHDKEYAAYSPDAIADQDYIAHMQDTKPHYPAHPGPRSHTTHRLHRNPDSGTSTVSPVLSREPSGDHRVQIYHRKKEKEKEKENEARDRGSSEGEGSGTTAVEEENSKLEDEFGGQEVRDWATRVNSRGDELDERGRVVSSMTPDFDITILGHG